MSSVWSDFLTPAYDVVTSGLGGIAILAFWQRWIVPGAAYNDIKTERDEWKQLYEKEREAHQATREAFTAASQRSDAGFEAAKVTTALIDALREEGRRHGDHG